MGEWRNPEQQPDMRGDRRGGPKAGGLGASSTASVNDGESSRPGAPTLKCKGDAAGQHCLQCRRASGTTPRASSSLGAVGYSRWCKQRPWLQNKTGQV